MTGVGSEEDAQEAAWPTSCPWSGQTSQLGEWVPGMRSARLSQVGMGARETPPARESCPAADLQVG